MGVVGKTYAPSCFGSTRRVQGEVVPVPPEYVSRLWGSISQIARRRLPDYDRNRLRSRAIVGRETIWLALGDRETDDLQGMLVTSITRIPPSDRKMFRHPGDPAAERSLTVHFFGGRNPGNWILNAVERISRYGRENGCRQLFILAQLKWMCYVAHFYGEFDTVAYARDVPYIHGKKRGYRNQVGYFRVMTRDEKERDKRHVGVYFVHGSVSKAGSGSERPVQA